MATWHDLVRRFIPDATDEECHFFLWEKTCFPFGSVLQVSRQLKNITKDIEFENSMESK